MATFKKQRIDYAITASGSIDVEYEVGAETPEQKFCELFDTEDMRTARLWMLMRDSQEFDHVISYVISAEDGVAVGPTQEDLDEEQEAREFAQAMEDEAQQFRDHPMGRD